MSKSLTQGSPWKVILTFAIPLLIGNVVQQMYQVVDAIVVGRHLGVDALAAVGTTGGLMFLLMGLAWGMTTGFAIPTAQAFGAEDEDGVRRSVAAGTLLTALTSILITGFGVFGARSLLKLLQTPTSLLEGGTTFATIMFAGSSAVLFFNYFSAILRSRGDSRTPLVFLIISSGINIALVILFVQHLELGVGGAAGATVVSQLLSVILCLAYIRKAVPSLKATRQDFLTCGGDIMAHLRLGLPMGFQTSIIAIGALAVQVRLNTLGPDAVAAYTAATRVDGLAVAFLASLGLAGSTFVAQNYGARLYERIRVGVNQALAMGVGAALVLALLLITGGTVFIRAFVGEGNDDVVTMAHQFLVVNGAFYFVLAILFVSRGALQGVGRMMVPTASGMLELGMRVGAAVVLGGALGFTGIVWANPLAWMGATVMLIPAWLKARKRLLPEDFRKTGSVGSTVGDAPEDDSKELQRLIIAREGSSSPEPDALEV